MSVSSTRFPILRVTVGSPVYTSDDQKIGEVKELKGNAFKVATPLFQRDYWLRGSAIAAAAPEAPVTLSVDKAHLDDQKLDEPPETPQEG